MTSSCACFSAGLRSRLRRSLRRAFLFTFWLAVGALPLFAQVGGGDPLGTGGNNTIQGRIYLPGSAGSDVRMKVRLESLDMANLSTITDANGGFRFNGLQAGNYTIIVEGDRNFETFREAITIQKRGPTRGTPPQIITVPIYLRLKNSPASGETKVGTVDASLASVPPPALELYNRALAAAKQGDSKAAIKHLQDAIAAHPEFALALNELGVQHLKLGRADKALEPLRAALKFAPESFSPRLNYGIALLETQKFAEAESELRQAIAKNPASPVAHLYLGVALVKLKNLEEAEKALTVAARSERQDLSIAHYYLGGIHWGNRRYQQAAEALETYLRLMPEAPDAARIRRTIQELREKKPPAK